MNALDTVNSNRADVDSKIKALQQMIGEVTGDLEDFMEEYETKTFDKERLMVAIPEEQYEEVVDLVVNDARERAEEGVQGDE